MRSKHAFPFNPRDVGSANRNQMCCDAVLVCVFSITLFLSMSLCVCVCLIVCGVCLCTACVHGVCLCIVCALCVCGVCGVCGVHGVSCAVSGLYKRFSPSTKNVHFHRISTTVVMARFFFRGFCHSHKKKVRTSLLTNIRASSSLLVAHVLAQAPVPGRGFCTQSNVTPPYAG